MASFSEIASDRSPHPDRLLEERIRECEQALDVHLTIHDHTGFFRDERDRPLLVGRNIHHHPFCQRQRRPTVAHCQDHCSLAVHRAVAERRKPLTTACWKGVREIVLPLVHDEVLIATLFVGTWRGPRPPDRREGLTHSAAFLRAWDRLPAWNATVGTRLVGQLQLWAEGLVRLVERIRFADSEDRAIRIKRLIARHAHQAFTLRRLAEALHLSSSRTSHLVREVCGASFQELLLNERMARARVLLVASPHSIGAIAERCGFADQSWFARVFHREVGMPPGTYRRRVARGSTPGAGRSPAAGVDPAQASPAPEQ